ncbi:MAG: hypothetical protein GY935_25265 [Gammaproteobacteria bacterium]|nr:hypothetical protein [Gammaproteobacteria bacterium]
MPYLRVAATSGIVHGHCQSQWHRCRVAPAVSMSSVRPERQTVAHCDRNVPADYPDTSRCPRGGAGKIASHNASTAG